MALRNICTGFLLTLKERLRVIMQSGNLETSVSQMNFIVLPASFASKESAQGFSVFVLFLLPENVVLHGPSSLTALFVALLSVADFWVCDNTISTTPVTRQQTPNTSTRAAKSLPDVAKCKTVRGIFSSRLARLYQGQYLTKFCFYGEALITFKLNTTSSGKLYFYLDEKWPQVEQSSQCQNKLDMAQYSFGLDLVSGENKFSPWDDPKVWHVMYADSVTCEPSVPALDDVTFTLEMLNPDSGGKPTSHCGCDETGLLSFYEVLAFLYFAGAIAYGQRLWQTIQKGGPMHLVIKMLSIAMIYQATGHFLTLIHLYRYSKDGEGYPFLNKLSTAADGLAGYQMLLMMAKLSTGWTLSSSFSTLDPKQMKQISIGVIAISVFEVIIASWEMTLLLVLIKIVVAGAFGVNISRKVTEERSTLRREFYIKFAKCCLTWLLAYPALAILSLVLPIHSRFKVITWGLLTAQCISILLLYRLFLSRSLYWEVSSLAPSTLPLRLDRSYGTKTYNSESRTVRIHKHVSVN